MENQLWNLFCSTGDPRTYLLYKAGEKQEKENCKEPPKPQTQPASVSI